MTHNTKVEKIFLPLVVDPQNFRRGEIRDTASSWIPDTYRASTCATAFSQGRALKRWTLARVHCFSRRLAHARVFCPSNAFAQDWGAGFAQSCQIHLILVAAAKGRGFEKSRVLSASSNEVVAKVIKQRASGHFCF